MKISNLLLEILEEMEFDRLLAEGKDPVEILRYKYKNVPDEIIDKVVSIDPTKKKSYSQWLLSKWNDESDVIKNNLKNGRIAKLFQHYKSHSDIQIKDCPSVSEGLRDFVPEEDTVLTKSDKPTTYVANLGKEVDSELANDFDIVFNQDNWIIAVPNTYEAECKLGENMEWCTANSFGNGKYYYDRYLNDYGGKYYVNFDMSKGESSNGKDYPFTRYQFHFESNQSMDKNDDHVELDEIGMPESAGKFYDEEGYDVSNFGNLDKMRERYVERRANSEHEIVDNLKLNIKWDFNYQYVEPNEDTDFFLFANGDNLDHICNEPFDNPHYDNSFIFYITENVVLLKSKRNCIISACKDTYGHWFTTLLDMYHILPNNIGVVAYRQQHYIFLLGNETSYNCIKDFSTKPFDNVFVNESCTNFDYGKYGRVFVEVVAGDVHSLFAITEDEEVEVIIPKDKPENGSEYTIGQNGIINGTYRKYKAYEYAEYDNDDDDVDYYFETKIENGCYLIYKVSTGKYNEKMVSYNILDGTTHKVVCEEWFTEYSGIVGNVYLVSKQYKYGLFSINDGKLIGKWYDNVDLIDENRSLMMCKVFEEKYDDYSEYTYSEIDYIDFVNAIQCNVYYTVNDIIGDVCDNKIVVVDKNNDAKIFDYVNCKFLFPKISVISQVNKTAYYCSVNGQNYRIIFDLGKEEILSDKIDVINKTIGGLNKLEKIDGKINYFNRTELKELLPNDADEVVKIDKSQYLVVYQINYTYYVYDYLNKSFIISSKGIPFVVYEYDGLLELDNEKYYVVFSIQRGVCKMKYWGSMDGTQKNESIDGAPEQVMDIYNYVNNTNESIRRQFYKYLNMINETRKLYW